MPDYFGTSFTGVKDNTKTPPDRADNRMVNAKQRTITNPKSTTQAYAIADRHFAGTVRAGERVIDARLNVDTSLGTTTCSLGTTALPTKYVNAAVLTTPLNQPVTLGPRSAAHAAGPLTADEDLYWTFGVAGIGAAVNLISELDVVSQT